MEAVEPLRCTARRLVDEYFARHREKPAFFVMSTKTLGDLCQQLGVHIQFQRMVPTYLDGIQVILCETVEGLHVASTSTSTFINTNLLP